MHVLTEKKGVVTTIIINRPEVRNAVDGATARELAEAFRQFEQDDDALAAVLTGTGGYFCAGADLKAVSGGEGEAKRAEHGYGHSSIIHSMNVEHMTTMAKEMDTTIFVKNGPCVAGLGLGGEGYLSYSIATTTGEGITTPKTFARIRRCVMVENLHIV